MDSSREQREIQAQECLHRAQEMEEGEALPLLQKAMLLYAEAYRLAQQEQTVSLSLVRTRADVCRLYAEALARHSRHAEATNIFQEAVDLYGELISRDDHEKAKACAKRALDSIMALNRYPHDRLNLLIAHHDRQRQQLALQTGTMAQQGDCSVHIAQILQRRNRPQEAIFRYTEALELYGQAEPSNALCLAQADCHQHLGDLCVNLMDSAEIEYMTSSEYRGRAVVHYTIALALWREYEPPFQSRQMRAERTQQALNDLNNLI